MENVDLIIDSLKKNIKIIIKENISQINKKKFNYRFFVVFVPYSL